MSKLEEIVQLIRAHNITTLNGKGLRSSNREDAATNLSLFRIIREELEIVPQVRPRQEVRRERTHDAPRACHPGNPRGKQRNAATTTRHKEAGEEPAPHKGHRKNRHAVRTEGVCAWVGPREEKGTTVHNT